MGRFDLLSFPLFYPVLHPEKITTSHSINFVFQSGQRPPFLKLIKIFYHSSHFDELLNKFVKLGTFLTLPKPSLNLDYQVDVFINQQTLECPFYLFLHGLQTVFQCYLMPLSFTQQLFHSPEILVFSPLEDFSPFSLDHENGFHLPYLS